MSATPVVLTADDVLRCIGPREARQAVLRGFLALFHGQVEAPPAMSFLFDQPPGDAHVKGAWIRGSSTWTVKVAAGFYDNARQGLPVASGLTLAFSAETGRPEAVVLDDGLLTELRAGAAGGLSADLLARRDIDHALIVGAGGQARYQLDALLDVRTPTWISVWARRGEAAAALSAEAERRWGRTVEVAPDLERAVRSADLIITTTPATEPLIFADWLSPGTHITAMGSDSPGKQELDPGILSRAGVVAVDWPENSRAHGELQHVPAGSLSVVSLGAIAAGAAEGRTSEDQITVADLVGLGVQDAAITEALLAAMSDAAEVG